MTTIKDNIPSVLKELESQLIAKKSLLACVFSELNKDDDFKNRQNIRDIIGVEPSTSFQASGFQGRVVQVIGFEDMISVLIEIVNNSNEMQITPRGYIALDNAISRSVLHDENRNIVNNIKALSTGKLSISFPSHLFFGKPCVSIVLECQWENSGLLANIRPFSKIESATKLNGTMFEIERPMMWKSLEDFIGSNEEEAKELLAFCSSILFTRSFPNISIYAFRKQFPYFNNLDYGDWQCFLGMEHFKGILVSSSPGTDYGIVNLVYGRCQSSLQNFITCIQNI